MRDPTDGPFHPPNEARPDDSASWVLGIFLAGAVALSAPSVMWWAVSYSPVGWAGYLLWTLWLMPVPGLLSLRRAHGGSGWADLLRLHASNAVLGVVGTSITAMAATGRLVSVPRASAFLVAVPLCLFGQLGARWVAARWRASDAGP